MKRRLPFAWRLKPHGSRILSLLLFCSFFFVYGCEDRISEDIVPQPGRTSSKNQVFYDHSQDTVETATVLAYQLPNPYTVANMRQAYSNVKGGNWSHIAANNLYVRFKPTSKEQLLTLLETMDLELDDTPLDYKIAQEGDFYQDPAIPADEITWQYAVVPTGYSFPAGIQYQVLANVHLPAEADYAVEAEAERLAGLNGDGDDLAGANSMQNSLSMDAFDLTCAPGFVWDREQKKCVEICGEGTTWNEELQACVSNSPTPTPPVRAGGRITVFDTNFNTLQGVRKLRVVAKRWFKIERMYTNDNGNFTSTKNFRNKVKVIVKFKNGDASVKHVRGARLWEMLDATKWKLGTYSAGAINSIDARFPFDWNNSTLAKRNWAAASIHNAVQEFKDYSALEGTPGLPGNLKILMSNFSSSVGGSAPLFARRLKDELPLAFVEHFVVGAAHPAAAVASAIIFYLRTQIDITTHFRYVSSDELKETMYHELAHASLYTQAGNAWYDSVVNHTLVEMIDGPAPYGTGTERGSPMIAMNEGWAYHYGRYLAGFRYTNTASCVNSQKDGQRYSSNGTGCGIADPNPHWAAIEDFNPRLLNDPFKWIPKGLFNDLRDNTPNELVNLSTVDDQVFGYTNQQLINAIDSDITSPQAYQARLLLENNNYQALSVNALFSSYNY
jgi:hypothetical protein